ncbi:hypothetical protein [Paraburkholderia aromaticivorans]|uniref:hypothetical protein n=1 Tax=Paraburkholderia aromaticivorans TaxID=2026199 RepID=UPI001455DDDA|nr:hypothetical protein [Paraburkholderia aromaticivorans]
MEIVNAKVADYYEKLGPSSSPEAEHRRETRYMNKGDTLHAHGNLDAARKSYKQAWRSASAGPRPI